MAYKIKLGEDDFSLVNLSGLPALAKGKGCSFSLYENANKHSKDLPSAKRKCCVVAEVPTANGALTFAGRSKNFGDASLQTAATGYKYMVGVRDKKNRTVTLHTASVYHLTPVVDTEDEDVQEDSRPVTTFAQKMGSLTETFGSAKNQRLLADSLKNRLDVGTLESSLAPAFAAAEQHMAREKERMEADPDPQPEDDLSQLRPPCNLAAATPAEVYRLQDLVPQSDLAPLAGLARTVLSVDVEGLARDWSANDRLPGVVVQRLAKLCSPSPSPAALEKAQNLLYAACLVTLHLQPIKNLYKHGGDFPEDIPEKMKRCVLKRFAQPAGKGGLAFQMSRQQKDRLLNYLLALLLVLDEYSLATDGLAKELLITANKLHGNLKYLGCNMTKSAAVLKVPLSFPKLRDRSSRSSKN